MNSKIDREYSLGGRGKTAQAPACRGGRGFTDVVRRATVSASWLESACQQAIEFGLCPVELRRAAGLHEGVILPPAQRALYRRHWALWECIEQMAPAPGIGIEMAGIEAVAHDMDLMGYLVRASSSMVAALHTLEQFGPLLNQNAIQRGRVMGECVVIEDGPRFGPQWSRPYVEHAAALYVLTLRNWTECSDARPTRAAFPFARPDSIEAYESFFGSNLSFDAPCLQLYVPMVLAEATWRFGDSTLKHHLEHRAHQLLGELRPSSRQRVSRYLELHLEESPKLGEVAKALALSERSLQRRLDDEGVSFLELLDQMRRDRATTLLANPEFTILNCSDRCGFAHGAAFRRAFHRWFGVSPSLYRKNLPDSTVL